MQPGVRAMGERVKPVNKFQCVFPAKSVNESFARTVVSSFVSQLDPRMEALAALITAVSEYYSGGRVVITIKDRGCGIEDVEQAMQPLFTTDAESERSGMGFTVMESFCDRVRVRSKPGKGTTVRLEKRILLT